MSLRPILRTDATQSEVGRFLITAMILGFASLIATGFAAIWVYGQMQDHAGWVDHGYKVEVAIADARVGIEQAETARRAYLLTGDPAAIATYSTTEAGIVPSIARIAALTNDNPRQRARIARLDTLLAQLRTMREVTIALVRDGRRDQAQAAFVKETAAGRLRDIRQTFDAMLADERGLMTQRDANLQSSARTFYAVVGVAGLLLILVAIASVLTVMRYTRDLAASRNRLGELNETLEDQVAERTSDLRRANEEIQRFAYIVSHDLRSPLVNVMGFTAELDAATRTVANLIERAEATAPEIVTEDARLAAREDLPEAIGFIRTSTQKMDRLINAILKLSREGRRVLTPEPIDLVALFKAIQATLQHRIDEDGVDFAITAPMPAIVTDRLALEQILSNLVENAIKYREPGRPLRLTVRGRQQGVHVTIEVEDNGRGIAASDRTRIFDLFRRAGNQDVPGEGIGLAHVRALAYRLGGTIDVDSELGRGSLFRLNLPATFTQDASQ
jgi:signal transduction histidine kinase